MDIIQNILLFVVGIAFLYSGGEGLVKGSSRLARSFGINPVVIGLTIVAFGTSAPEFVVSIIAVLRDSNDLVIGNIVGSLLASIVFPVPGDPIIRRFGPPNLSNNTPKLLEMS
jgi:cation:H+ antiporter